MTRGISGTKLRGHIPAANVKEASLMMPAAAARFVLAPTPKERREFEEVELRKEVSKPTITEVVRSIPQVHVDYIEKVTAISTVRPALQTATRRPASASPVPAVSNSVT